MQRRHADSARRGGSCVSARGHTARRGCGTCRNAGKMRSISWLLLFAACGCDTRSSASESHDSGSGDAQRLARVKEREHGVPCSTYAVGSEVHYSEFVLHFETPIIAEPELRLPWIASDVERATLRGSHVLIVPLAMRNTARVPRSPPHGFTLLTRDGIAHHGWTYNERVWSQQHGRRVHWE